MKCPKCGKENPNSEQVCSGCSYVLMDSVTEQQQVRPKTSKMAIVSVLLVALATGFMSVFIYPTLAFLAALFGVVTAITSIGEIRKSKRKLIGKSLATGAIIFSSLQIVLLSYWRIDAAPILDDYTISNIRSASSKYNQSYELLNSLAGEGDDRMCALAIGLSEQDVESLEEISKVFKEADYGKISAGLKANAESILLIWQNAKKGRDVITKLSTYPEIADLMEPQLKADFPYLKNLKRLLQLYQAYICLQSCQGNEQIAIYELVKLDSIFKKLSLNARSLVSKLVCIACFAVDIQTANFIINNPQTSQESLELLVEDFTLPAREHVSLSNSIIFEYLMFRNEVRKISMEPKLKYSSFSPLKLNSTFRLYKNFCNKWIAIEEGRIETEGLTVWPAVYPKLPVTMDTDGRFPWYYKVYNPVGSMIAGIMMPALERVFQVKTRLEIHSDLFQIILNKRLGKEVSLKARAYSDEYIIDVEKKNIFSPGPDGKPYTEDDIKLPINPEALGLLSQ